MARKYLAIASVLVAASAGAAVPHPAQADPGDRSVSATVRNYSDERLSLIEFDVSEGEWLVKPPKGINRNKTVTFSAESTKDTGGTAATATYKTRFGKVEFYLSNPWTQSSDYICDVPDELRCDVEGAGDANEAQVAYVIRYS
ncbi:hypothetical protein Aca07nite_10280 [Actinoplanes capillaceus]|uniref:Uncharacterized protein n=1 Tax=Actinoplanes campanulatus TaxID=113559 RepID=A0ABQ3WEB7_9ACTN|nr:hypothetical protein [Actinoplanes capillaceus]GID43753.1 hypothetical protein Aca07nite_10280 [Actinoplanes capillaceus]